MRHLRKELALVFEFMPKFSRQPAPRDKPWSTMAMPSPEVMSSWSLKGEGMEEPVGFDCVAEEAESGRTSSDEENVYSFL